MVDLSDIKSGVFVSPQTVAQCPPTKMSSKSFHNFPIGYPRNVPKSLENPRFLIQDPDNNPDHKQKLIYSPPFHTLST